MIVNRWMMAAVAVVLAGCRHVRDAHEMQMALSERGVGVAEAGRRVDLRGSSLEQLVCFATTNRPSVAAASLAMEDAELALRQLRADAPIVSSSPWYSPKVSVGAGYDAASASSHLDDLKIRTDGGVSGSLSLELLIYDFGRYEARARAAIERLIASEEEFIRSQFAVFEEVSSAYFSTLEKDALLEVAFTNELEYAEHLRRAEDLLKAGEARQLDVLRARQDLATAREATVSASNEVATANAELMRALGIDVRAGSRAEVLESAGVPALSRLRRGFAETAFGVEEAFAFAHTNAPSVQVARARLRAAIDDVDCAVADLLPSISASASLNFSDPFWMWRWGANVAQSLFAGGRKVTAIDRAVVAMKSAAADVDRAEQELSHAISVAVAERDNARAAQRTAEDSLKQAHENLETVREQFALGEASRVDFTDAVSAYAAALGSRTRAFYRAQRAESRLFAVLGQIPRFREELVF